jgi:heparan-alpha-glucosaminide N-acetyltransferase
LSIPFALNKRMQSNESRSSIAWHIITRSFALIVMGFFQVNTENYSRAAILPEPVFEILMTLAFFLIWLDYKPTLSKRTQNIFQAAGIIILIALAILYKGEKHDQEIWLRPQWWGILGLIGWGYLTCALVYLFTKRKLSSLIIALILFLAYNIISQTYLLDPVSGILKYCWFIGNGSEISLIMAGIIISTIYRQRIALTKSGFLMFTFFLGGLMIAFGFITRPFGGISKIDATPSWVGICIGISIIVFLILILLVDVKNKAAWFNIIKPAGTSTLTCYLIPYFLYSFLELSNVYYPKFLTEGAGGIIRSFAIAFIVIFITRFLEKKNLRLKI